MKDLDILSIRDDLDRELRNVEGVFSVGVGKANDDYVLVVIIDRELFQGGIPTRYRGFDVITRDPGRADSFTDGRL